MMKKNVLIVFAIIFIFALSFIKNVDADHAACSNKDYPQRERRHEPTERQPTQPPLKTTTIKTQTVAILPLQPDKTWQPVQGYTQGFNECLSFCNAYRSQKCSQQSAIAYCTAMFSVDLNKAGSINANEFGRTPVGRSVCETNVHCFDLIKDCSCSSQSLNLQSCVSLLYTAYSNQHLSVQQAYATISQSLVGSCHQPSA
jgi:hypothetical protein